MTQLYQVMGGVFIPKEPTSQFDLLFSNQNKHHTQQYHRLFSWNVSIDTTSILIQQLCKLSIFDIFYIDYRVVSQEEPHINAQ